MRSFITSTFGIFSIARAFRLPGGSVRPVRIPSLRSRCLQITVAFIVFVGWLMLSNHCALAGLEKKPMPEQEHRCCHRDAAESQNHGSTPPAAMVQCCKTLGVTTPEAAKVPPASQSLLAILPLMLTLCFDALGHQPTAVISLETGPPPRSLPFTTLVLQDCVQAHAPPRA